MVALIAAIIGYGIGSIPFGLILSKLAGYGDIRAIGSGNIGATNVLRTGDKKLALAVLLLDGGKGALAVLLARHFGGDGAALAAGLTSVIGHMVPIWLVFKGGKGVATALGMLLALAPFAGLGACAVWMLTAFAFRYSSLAALAALAAAPPLAYILYEDENLIGVCAIVATLVWLRHRANIRRLVAGEEPKIGKKR